MKFGIALIVIAGVLHIGLGVMFFRLRSHYGGRTEPEHPELPPPPRLQSNPSADLQQYLDRERKLLSTYGWVDQKAGVARIPIDRAMDLLGGSNE